MECTLQQPNMALPAGLIVSSLLEDKLPECVKEQQELIRRALDMDLPKNPLVRPALWPVNHLMHGGLLQAHPHSRHGNLSTQGQVG